MTTQPTMSTDPSRRQVLCGLAVALLAPGALAVACGGDSGTDTTPGSGNGGTGGGATTSAGAGATSGSGGGSPSGGLAKLSDVPVGGGLIVTTGPSQVLLVRTGETEVKAYDPRCTHQRFTVDPPRNGVITCQNHGSQFQASDGSVTKGPATSPLASIAVKIDGDSIVLA